MFTTLKTKESKTLQQAHHCFVGLYVGNLVENDKCSFPRSEYFFSTFLKKTLNLFQTFQKSAKKYSDSGYIAECDQVIHIKEESLNTRVP